ncbi:MAG: Lrp/AsnC ligand binding domain-containing protein [Bacteroidales bacterium]|nr:Lrp/AsnC ligand binding domain-containing protein [Bacteroidales bacterium]
MVTAIVLINAQREKINSIGEQISGFGGVTEVFSVSGRFDLVVLIRLKELNGLSQLMTEKISNIEGIIRTESMVTFKLISKHDIAAMFDLGS